MIIEIEKNEEFVRYQSFFLVFSWEGEFCPVQSMFSSDKMNGRYGYIVNVHMYRVTFVLFYPFLRERKNERKRIDVSSSDNADEEERKKGNIIRILIVKNYLVKDRVFPSLIWTF